MNYSALIKSLPDKALRHINDLPFKRIASGKVREIFDTGEHLLIVASDRLSAFDVVLPDGIPGKVIILTQMSLHWFEETREIVQNHLVENHDEAIRELLVDFPELVIRSMLVRKLRPLPVEAVVRQYLAGSGWKD